MPIFLAILGYWIHLLRRPMDARLKRRLAGASAILVLGIALVALWVRQRPAGLTDLYVWGEIAGVLAVYLMTWSLLLATRARWLEPWYGGLDQMYLWHRRSAVAGMLLLLPHAIMTSAGRPADERASTVGLALGFFSALGLFGLVAISLPVSAEFSACPTNAGSFCTASSESSWRWV